MVYGRDKCTLSVEMTKNQQQRSSRSRFPENSSPAASRGLDSAWGLTLLTPKKQMRPCSLRHHRALLGRKVLIQRPDSEPNRVAVKGVVLSLSERMARASESQMVMVAMALDSDPRWEGSVERLRAHPKTL